MKSYFIEEEGMTALVDELKDNSLSFHLSHEGKTLPYYCSARRISKTKIFIFVQFPDSESSAFIYVEEQPTTPLINLLAQLVQESLEIVEHHNLLGEST